MKEKRKTIGQVISEFRKIKKVSQKKMAEDLVISIEKIQFLESSDILPDAGLLKRIIEYLGIPIQSVIFDILKEEDFKDSDIEIFKAAKKVMECCLHILLYSNPPDIDIDKSTISDN